MKKKLNKYIYTEEELGQRTDDWKKFRDGGIGASDAATVYGNNPYKTAHELFLVRIGEAEPDNMDDNNNVIRGTIQEDCARKYASSRLVEGKDYDFKPYCLIHADYEWMRCSLDGLDMKEVVGLELKCPTQGTFKTIYSKGTPVYYYTQVQHQLEILRSHFDIDELFFVAFQPNDERVLYIDIIKYDKEFVEKLIEAEYEFWNKVLTQQW